MSDRRPHREICSLCHEVSRVGFHVPDEVWELATHVSQRNNLICLRCFTRLADERGVEWDREITFYPVSRVSHDRGSDGNQRDELREALARKRPGAIVPVATVQRALGWSEDVEDSL